MGIGHCGTTIEFRMGSGCMGLQRKSICGFQTQAMWDQKGTPVISCLVSNVDLLAYETQITTLAIA